MSVETWSARHRAILQLLWDGLSLKEAADELGLTLAQVHQQVRTMKAHTEARSTIHLLRCALRAGVVQP